MNSERKPLDVQVIWKCDRTIETRLCAETFSSVYLCKIIQTVSVALFIAQ